MKHFSFYNPVTIARQNGSIRGRGTAKLPREFRVILFDSDKHRKYFNFDSICIHRKAKMNKTHRLQHIIVLKSEPTIMRITKI